VKEGWTRYLGDDGTIGLGMVAYIRFIDGGSVEASRNSVDGTLHGTWTFDGEVVSVVFGGSDASNDMRLQVGEGVRIEAMCAGANPSTEAVLINNDAGWAFFENVC
jgi:beta-glucosidase-like glycosyl hydrolase